MDTIGGWALHMGLKVASEVTQGLEIQQDQHLWVIGEVDNYQIKEVIFKQNILKHNVLKQ